MVLEYASPDARKAVVTLFRTSSFGDPVYRLTPRGLDASQKYRVTFENRGETAVLSGIDLMRDGIPVTLQTAETSEMLVFESENSN